MLGLLTPDEGEIEVMGTTPIQARSLIGYMPQYLHFDPHFPATVLEIVLMGRMKDGTHSGDSNAKMNTAPKPPFPVWAWKVWPIAPLPVSPVGNDNASSSPAR